MRLYLTALLGCLLLAPSYATAVLVDFTISGEGNAGPASPGYMLAFARDGVNGSQWVLVAIDLASAMAHTVLATERSSPATSTMCAYALIDPETVAFFNANNDSLWLEKWNLRTKSLITRENVYYNILETLDYNPASKELEGACEMMVPGQNFTAPYWCRQQGQGATSIYPLPTGVVLEQVRSDCTSYLDPKTSIFWTPTGWYEQRNIFFLGMVTGPPSNSSYDWKWYGAINGTPGFDAYAHDDVLDRSFAIQVGPDNTTTQLVEVFSGTHPNTPNENPMPRVLYAFPSNENTYRLSKAGLSLYDSDSHHMYAIMEKHVAHKRTGKPWLKSDDADKTQYLAQFDVVAQKVILLPIQWPQSEGELQVGSVRHWTGLP